MFYQKSNKSNKMQTIKQLLFLIKVLKIRISEIVEKIELSNNWIWTLDLSLINTLRHPLSQQPVDN